MSAAIDITGQTFGRLTATGLSVRKAKRTNLYYECICLCGNVVYVDSGNLRNGNTRSCGRRCRYSLLVGQTFGRLTVTALSDKKAKTGGSLYYECTCSCGNVTVASAANLRAKNTRSCGCLHSETSVKNRCCDGHRAFAADPDHAARLSWVYVTEVAGVVDKIGITFDMNERSRGADYTTTWWKRQMTRAQCWAVEQCALYLTREYRPAVAAGNANSGASEQRTGWVLEDEITMINELCDECLSVGWDVLYERYVLA